MGTMLVGYHALLAAEVPTFNSDAKLFGLGGQALPAELARRRLPYNPNGRLPIDEPRFVARDENELLASIFTWWNLLDGLMLLHEPAPHSPGLSARRPSAF